MANKNYNELNRIAVSFFKAHDIKRIATAISGSEESLVMLNAAVQVLGNENVLAIVADTGYIPDKVLDIIEKACELVNVDICILPVFLNTAHGDIADYKQQIFSEMLHECWLMGYDILAYACTKENYAKNGNEVIATFDGVVCPMLD